MCEFFGKGKCKLIANFSATMVTSLPTVSVSLSLSHREHLTHIIISVSPLPIIPIINVWENPVHGVCHSSSRMV